MEEIRRDAVSRRCHVNHGEVESLALVLSQLSRAMAQLKSMLEYTIIITMQLDVGIVKRLPILNYRAYRVPELIPVLGSQPAGGVSHKPGGRLPLLSARPAVTPAK